MKLSGVYLAVRILFRSNSARGWPLSSLASFGSGMLKKIRLGLLSRSSPSSMPPSPCPTFRGSSTESFPLFSVDPFLSWKRFNILPRFFCSLFPVTRCVAQRFRLIGFEIRLLIESGFIATADIQCEDVQMWKAQALNPRWTTEGPVQAGLSRRRMDRYEKQVLSRCDPVRRCQIVSKLLVS